MTLFKKYFISKRILAILLSIILVLSTIAVISTVSFTASALTVEGGSQMLGSKQASWKIHKVSESVYKLQNVETGLYMTMESDNGEYSLIQDNELEENDDSQLFRFIYSGYTNSVGNHHFIIVHIKTNICIYASDDKNTILFGNANNWWTVFPDGASSKNNCQFEARGISETAIADGEIAIFVSANGMFLQSDKLRSDIDYDVRAKIVGENSSETETTGTIVVGKNKVSEDHSTWILGASGGGFTLKNKATNLYLTMENSDGAINLYQTVRKDTSDTSQIFKFNSVGGGNYCIYNIALNTVIYSNTSGDGVLFKSASSWWVAPSGADSNNKCQFALAKAPADNMEITIKIAGNSAYIQSGAKAEDPSISGDAVVIEKNKLGEEETIWVLGAFGGGFTLKNKATDLYLTMENINDTIYLYQSERRDASDTSQIFKFISVGGGYYCICHIDLNTVIYSNTSGNKILFKSASNWWTPPSGADSNNKCQFKLDKAPTDSMEITITFAGNGAYLQSYVEQDEADKPAELELNAYWKFVFVEDVVRNDGNSAANYKIQNKLTGLYLTSKGNNNPVIQNIASDNKEQIWQVVLKDGRWIIIDFSGNVLYYSAEKNDWLVQNNLEFTEHTVMLNNGQTDNKLPESDSVHTLSTNDYSSTVYVYSEFNGFSDYFATDELENVEKYPVNFTQNSFISEDATRWILDAEGKDFKLRNKETGLYLTVETSADGNKLVQTCSVDSRAQIWNLVLDEGQYLLKNTKTNEVLYAEQNKIAFKDYYDWSVPPTGFNNVNSCRFELSIDGEPQNGMITTFTISDDSKVLMCSGILKSDVKGYPLDSTDSILFSKVDDVQWKAQRNGDSFNIINCDTGLYLTRLSDSQVGLKTKDGSDKQNWKEISGDGGSYIVSDNGKVLDITSESVALAEQSKINTRIFNKISLSDGEIFTLKTLEGRYLVNGFEGFSANKTPEAKRLVVDTEKIEKYPVQIWKLQKSSVKIDGKLLYSLCNMATNKYLTITEKYDVQEADETNTYNQLFILKETNNVYKLIDVSGTKELSIENDDSVVMTDINKGYDSSFVLSDTVKDGLETSLLSSKDNKYLYTSYWNDDWVETDYRVYGFKTGTPKRQEWEFQLVDGAISSYKILNKSSGLYLTLQGNVLYQDNLLTGQKEKEQIFRLVRKDYYNGINFYMLLNANNKQLQITKESADKENVEISDINNWNKNASSWDPTWNSSNPHLFTLSAGNEAAGYPTDGLIATIKSFNGYKLEGDAPDATERFVTAVKQTSNSNKQRWVLFKIGSNFAIQNKGTKQFLTLNAKNRFVQADFTGALNQQWTLLYDFSNETYRLEHAATGLWLGVNAEEKDNPAKFISFDANTISTNTAWIINEIVDGKKIKLTDGMTPTNYGVYELSVDSPSYILQGELTGSSPQAFSVVVSSPETRNSSKTTYGTTLKMQATVTPPGLDDKIVWSAISNGKEQNSTVKDYIEFDADAGNYFSLLNIKDTGKVVVRASLESDPSIFDEFEFEVTPNFTELESLIRKLEDLEDGLYTQESYDSLVDDIEKAKAFVEKGDAQYQSQIQDVINSLNVAKDNLELNPDGAYRKEITENLKEPIVIPKEIFIAAKEEDRIRVYNIVDKDGKTLYSWRFEFDEESNPNYNVDLELKKDSENSKFIELFVGDTEHTILNFANIGNMPGNVKTSVFVGDQYEDNSLLDLYYFNSITSSGNLKKEKLEVIDGYITLEVDKTAEYFLVYAGKRVQETVDNDDNTDTNNTLDNTDNNPDVYASKISLELIKKAIESTTGDVAAIRLTEPGILTTEMMNELVAANKKLRVEITDSNGNVYLAWLFNGFTDTSKDFDLGWNEKSANEDSIKTLTKAELSQIISFKYEQLPGPTAVIIRNNGGFVTGSYLKLFSFDSTNGKLVAEQGKAVVSNDGQYLQVILSNANEYLVELDKNNKKPADNDMDESNNVLLIVLIIAGGVVFVGGIIIAVIIIAKKKKSKK